MLISTALNWEGIASTAPLEEAEPADIARICNQFSRFTAIGCDNVHPRHLSSLSSPAMKCMCRLMFWILNLAEIPEAIATILISLLPKAEGGTRPIGIIATLLRVFLRWARPRWGISWEKQNSRAYWHSQRGRSCERCTWRLSLYGEYAQAVGQTVASALIDVQRAFENIQHPYLVAMAKKHKFNLRMLRFLLVMYSGPRIVMVAKVTTAFVRAVGKSVIAG